MRGSDARGVCRYFVAAVGVKRDDEFCRESTFNADEAEGVCTSVFCEPKREYGSSLMNTEPAPGEAEASVEKLRSPAVKTRSLGVSGMYNDADESVGAADEYSCSGDESSARCVSSNEESGMMEFSPGACVLAGAAVTCVSVRVKSVCVLCSLAGVCVSAEEELSARSLCCCAGKALLDVCVSSEAMMVCSFNVLVKEGIEAEWLSAALDALLLESFESSCCWLVWFS